MSTIERRILYIGNFNVSYSTESHIALSLESLPGVTVYRVQEDKADWQFLPTEAANLGVDFALWTHTHYMADESKHDDCSEYLARMRDIGIPTVGYHLDRWWGLEREHQVYEPFFQQDIVCTADGGHDKEWEDIGVNHYWFPPAVVHTEVGRGASQFRYHKDVGFLGSWVSYGHRDIWPWRYDLVLALNKKYQSKFRVWPRGNVPIRGWEINALYASVKVMVGDSCLVGAPANYWSDRVPETLGRGGLLVHPEVEGLHDEFNCILPFTYEAGNKESLYSVVDMALGLSESDRLMLIDNAIDHVRDHHTYRERMKRLLTLVDQHRES